MIEGAVAPAVPPPVMAAEASAVSCRNVSVRFVTDRRVVTAFDNVSFTVARGGFLSNAALVLDFLQLPVLSVAGDAADDGTGRGPRDGALAVLAGLVADDGADDGAGEGTGRGPVFGVGAIGLAAGVKEAREQQGRADAYRDKMTIRVHGCRWGL